jgi:hypothetical protein
LAVDRSFALPTDVFETIEQNGLVTVVVGGITYYLDPVNLTDGLHIYNRPSNSPIYWIWPLDTLNLEAPLGTDGAMEIRYFAYYPLAENEEDEDALVLLPQWAIQPVSFLVGSYALAALAIQSANIDRWKESDDSGNPEHNALRAQQDYMFKQYERGIARYPVQDRYNFFRNYTRSSLD